MKLRKKHYQALEKIFGAEIEGLLPFQSKSQTFRELAEYGLATETHHVLGGGFTIKISGYELTHRGRHAYCCWANKQCPVEVIAS